MGIMLAGVVLVVLIHQLPDINALREIELQVPLRIYTSDGKLIEEYGEGRRIPVKLQEVPKTLINAVLATEDQRFYQHPGVDPIGLFRAVQNLVSTGANRKGVVLSPCKSLEISF